MRQSNESVMTGWDATSTRVIPEGLEGRQSLVVPRYDHDISCVMDEQLEFTKQIAVRLASVGIDYMLTGSMAMAVYATPRMTRDIDLVIAVARRDVDSLVRLFETDCYIDRGAVAEAIDGTGMFNIIQTVDYRYSCIRC